MARTVSLPALTIASSHVSVEHLLMAIVDTSLPEGRLDGMVQVLDALADRSRVLIVFELSRGPMSVGELTDRMSLAQSTVSVHLSVLYRSGLVSMETKRNLRVYSLRGNTALRLVALVQRFIAGNDRAQG